MKQYDSGFIKPICLWVLLLASMTMPTGLSRADGLGPLLGDYVLGPGGTDQAWSVWVGGNLEKTGIIGKLQGRAFVRGNLTVNNEPNNPNELGNVPGGVGVFPDPSLPAMVIGGDVLGTGSVKIVGNLSLQVGSNIVGTMTLDPPETVVSYGGVDYAAADTLRAELSAKSSYWGTLPDTPGGSIKVEYFSTKITGDGVNGNPQMWVFNLTNDLTDPPVLSGFEPGDSILINCNKAGSDDTFVISANSFSSFPDDLIPQVLWNFPDAAQLTISATDGVKGSLLMGNPNSVTTFSSPNGHRGRLVSCGNVNHEGGGTFFNYPFTGDFDFMPAFSGLKITSIKLIGNDVQIRWASVVGRVYAVEHVTKLGDVWLPVATGIIAADEDTPFMMPSADSGFFRVVMNGE